MPRRKLQTLTALTRHFAEPCVAFSTDQRPRLRSTEHLLQARAWRLDVERHVHRASLENRQQASQPVQRTFQQHRHRVADIDALRTQIMGETIGLLIQRLESHRLLEIPSGQRLRLPSHFTRPVLQHRQRRFAVNGKRSRPWCGNRVQWRLRRVEQLCKQVQQHRHKTGDRFRPIEIAGVGHLAVDQRAVVGDIQGQIEVRAVLGQRIFAYSQAGQGHRALFLHADVLVELGLEQRVVAQGALGDQFVDELLERQFLMRLRAERRFTHLREQIGETAALIDLATQHLGVDEETDQSLDFGAATVGIRHADTNVALAGQTRKEQREPGQHQHEQADALAARKNVELLRQVGAEIKAQGLSCKALRQRSGEVRRHFQQRMFVAQLLTPVVELALALAGLQPAPLPDRIVGVLQRQRRQLRLALQAERLIALHEFLDHDVHRPAIGDDVMHAHHQHELIVGQGKQARAQQRAMAQIERLRGDVLHVLREQFLALLRGDARQVEAFQRNTLLLKNQLMRLIPVGVKHRAQHFMARQQMVERAAQSRLIQPAFQTQASGHVVCGAVRFQLPEKQQALLGERQGNLRAVVAADRQRQQAEILALLAQLGEKQPTLFQRQADEPFCNTFRHRAAHTSSPCKAFMN